jgi:hypothetical protein
MSQDRLARLADRLERLRVAGRLDDPPGRQKTLRRRSISQPIMTVLASCGELRGRDIHAAVEALLGESVPVSSVKNCLAQNVLGENPLFERVGRGRYRLTASAAP